MGDLNYLFAAFALMWAGAMGYLIRLASLRKRLEGRIETLQERVESGDLRHG
jgi:CcmD family protein